MADIARAVLAVQCKLPSLDDNEFTVLAAIVAEDMGSEVVQVLSLATGTKCCGEAEYGEVRKQGTIVSDSHAEILARRTFHLYILECISALLGAGEVKASSSSTFAEAGSDDGNILELAEGKARLKKGVSLSLYISDNPCGDASIYSRRGGEEDKEGFTGAKRVRKCDSERESEGTEEEKQQKVGVLRTKSGRSDIPDKYRTASISCSDKICRWIQLGLQGSLLSPFVEHLPIKRVVVGLDPLATDDSQLAALKRALMSRVENASAVVEVVDSCCPSFTKSKCMAEQESLSQWASMSEETGEFTDKKKRKRGGKPRPSGTSVNWLKDVRGSFLSLEQDSRAKEKGGKKKEKIKRIGNGTLEITQVRSGALLGVSKTLIGTLSGSSRLCSRKRALLLASLIRQSSSLLDTSIRDSLAAANPDIAIGKDDEEALISIAVSMPYHWWKTVDKDNNARKKRFLSQPNFKDWLINQHPYEFAIGAID